MEREDVQVQVWRTPPARYPVRLRDLWDKMPEEFHHDVTVVARPFVFLQQGTGIETTVTLAVGESDVSFVLTKDGAGRKRTNRRKTQQFSRRNYLRQASEISAIPLCVRTMATFPVLAFGPGVVIGGTADPMGGMGFVFAKTPKKHVPLSESVRAALLSAGADPRLSALVRMAAQNRMDRGLPGDYPVTTPRGDLRTAELSRISFGRSGASTTTSLCVYAIVITASVCTSGNAPVECASPQIYIGQVGATRTFAARMKEHLDRHVQLVDVMLQTTRPGDGSVPGIPSAFALILDVADNPSSLDAIEKAYIDMFSAYTIAGMNMKLQ